MSNSPPTENTSVRGTDLRLSGRAEGKVRDVYHLPPGTIAERASLLLVASDRISAFDVVMPSPIPGKGILLTEIATFWLRMIESAGLCRTHLISTDAGLIPESAFDGASVTRADLHGRSMIGQRCRVVPIECVVRGYLEGSGWKDYRHTGGICGVELPRGLQQCERLPHPIFTPATKAERGTHDENVSFEQACAAVGRELMERLRDVSLAIYAMASAHAEKRGIIIADTKFEFGLPVDEAGRIIDDEPMLIDEALTPDSSRFWPEAHYRPGGPQKSFDKQFLREYLETLVESGRWDKSPPGPRLPEDVVQGTLERYREARDRLVYS
ncbi:MAG: phosphoribosylaminoimidazolesuccinocarboxamide synthase [Phycisphaeraceae bacterium]|nr:phosphoribosylaminoimidazolesuccinocarboxamide synthase [Phycisphaeraceae bacterium]MCW5763265.1 phosphoribosylaminoimidazolesuccinocarboxamide synthase [Phycisphaeraceae bacterium]